MEHQLSVAALGEPLLLLHATRRIASNLLVGANEESERGSEGGRLAGTALPIHVIDPAERASPAFLTGPPTSAAAFGAHDDAV